MRAWVFASDQTDAFNLSAMAEWSWNSTGRTPSQFSRAWALRSGRLSEAEARAFVEWQALLGPVEWDVYDSEFPTAYNCGYYIDGPEGQINSNARPGLETFMTERIMPRLGIGPFRYFPTTEALVSKQAACRAAAALVPPPVVWMNLSISMRIASLVSRMYSRSKR